MKAQLLMFNDAIKTSNMSTNMYMRAIADVILFKGCLVKLITFKKLFRYCSYRKDAMATLNISKQYHVP